MLANRTQRWWAIGAAVSVVLLVVAWFLLIGPRRAEAADINDQIEQLQSQTDQQQLRTAQLKADLAEVPKKKAELAAIKLQLPADADIPKTITDMEGFAGQAGVTIDQITPGAPSVAGATDGTATAAASADKPLLVQIPITLQVSGDFFETSLFLKSLQSSMSRSMLVQSTQVATTAAAPAAATTDSTSGATGTATPSASPTATATAPPVSSTPKTEMTITGQLFVLLDGAQTLADVKKDAADAAKTAS